MHKHCVQKGMPNPIFTKEANINHGTHPPSTTAIMANEHCMKEENTVNIGELSYNLSLN